MANLIKKIKLQYTIELITGLHIGGSSDKVEIGGLDNPVIKVATIDNQPYIPGSSLKGKMRCLLEQINGASQVGGCEKVNILFGNVKENKGTGKGEDLPTRLIVRDSYLTDESVQMLLNCDNMDMPFTETKYENSIDRIKGKAENPRLNERVPKGAKFHAEFIINIWDTDNEKDLRNLLEEGIKALENDYLGGSGTRGYGQIKFSETAEPEIIQF